MSRELDELVLLFTSLNTEYEGGPRHSTPEPNRRSLVGQKNLPPPVHFERRRQQRPAQPASANTFHANTELSHSADSTTNIHDNEPSSDVDSILYFLLNDRPPEDTILNIPHSLNELE